MYGTCFWHIEFYSLSYLNLSRAVQCHDTFCLGVFVLKSQILLVFFFYKKLAPEWENSIFLYSSLNTIFLQIFLSFICQWVVKMCECITWVTNFSPGLYFALILRLFLTGVCAGTDLVWAQIQECHNHDNTDIKEIFSFIMII